MPFTMFVDVGPLCLTCCHVSADEVMQEVNKLLVLVLLYGRTMENEFAVAVSAFEIGNWRFERGVQSWATQNVN